MEKFIDALIGIIQPPWSYLLGVAALLIVAMPRLIELRQNFLDVRMGRRQLELEKLRLEVQKLRMEMHQVPVIPEYPGYTPEREAISIAPPSVVKPPPTSTPREGLRGLLSKHPQFARPILWIGQILMAYILTICAVVAVVIPFVGWTDPELGPSLSIVIAFIYAAFAWLSYKGFTTVRSFRKEIVAR